MALVAVNLRKAKLLQPVHRWTEACQKMARSIPDGKITDFMFDDDSEEVSKLLLEMQLKADSRDAEADKKT